MSTTAQFAAPASPSTSPESPSSAPAEHEESAVGAPAPSAALGHRGATRTPIVAWLLPLVTFGVYSLVWHYKINRELRDFSPEIKVDPTLAMLALLLPVVGWVSVYKTGKRIAHAQLLSGAEPACSGGLGVLACFFFGLHAVYYQTHLNRAWATN